MLTSCACMRCCGCTDHWLRGKDGKDEVTKKCSNCCIKYAVRYCSPSGIDASASLDIEHAGELVARAVLRPGEPKVRVEGAVRGARPPKAGEKRGKRFDVRHET